MASDERYTGVVEIRLHVKASATVPADTSAKAVRDALVADAKRLVNNAAWQDKTPNGSLAFGKVERISWEPTDGE
ncbi:hypothetical protein DRQ32_03330 [bacterium]|nr:MAG: hypothetical protein DRQ32_03330 [bacterium]